MAMTITEALAEVKTIQKRIEKKQQAIRENIARDSLGNQGSGHPLRPIPGEAAAIGRQTCVYCEEEIKPLELYRRYANGPVAHDNCFLRGIIGSVAHQARMCGCYVPGSTENDPPGMTRREGADAAVAYAIKKRFTD